MQHMCVVVCRTLCDTCSWMQNRGLIVSLWEILSTASGQLSNPSSRDQQGLESKMRYEWAGYESSGPPVVLRAARSTKPNVSDAEPLFLFAQAHVCLVSAQSDGPDQADSLSTTNLSRVGHSSHAARGGGTCIWGRFRTARAQRGHSASYYGDYPGNNPENHKPAESCTINSKLKNSNI